MRLVKIMAVVVLAVLICILPNYTFEAQAKEVYKDTDNAKFTNVFLESWVREKLKKSPTDKITSIQFIGSQEVKNDTNSDFNIHITGIMYDDSKGGLKNVIGWDFYDVKDLV